MYYYRAAEVGGNCAFRVGIGVKKSNFVDVTHRPSQDEVKSKNDRVFESRKV